VLAAWRRHGDELPLEIERLWRTLAHNRRNIIPMLDFLASLGTHMSYQVSWQAPHFSAQHDTAYTVFLSVGQSVGLQNYDQQVRLMLTHLTCLCLLYRAVLLCLLRCAVLCCVLLPAAGAASHA
jgi:hypothetical protein